MKSNEFAGKHIALVGFDTEGKSSYDYYLSRGATITICDQNEQLQVPDGAQTVLGEHYLENLDRFDIVVRTAGLIPTKLIAANPGLEPIITTQINEFLRVCPTRKLIGVTGTKGKGTTSTLITRILKAAGHTVFLGGNIGVAPFTFLSELTADSWVVLELSSFQLIDAHYSPHIGVCLMVVPEHLNWHRDMEEYIAAKSQLFAAQNSDDIAIYFGDNGTSQEIASAGAAHKIPFYRSPGAFVNGNMITIDGLEICTTDELKLLGAHNWQNVCAAVTAVWQAGVHDIMAIRSVLSNFSGLEHRLELVRELNGIRFYDDSFGTTPETAIVAIQAFSQPKVVILGGSDKGASYDELAKTLAASNIRQVILIGNEGEKLRAAFDRVGFSQYSSIITGRGKMPEIISTALQHAKTGDVVLLSTGCASFDMFENYKDRGNQFQQAVRELRQV